MAGTSFAEVLSTLASVERIQEQLRMVADAVESLTKRVDALERSTGRSRSDEPG